uniref:Uncharacterized protein n=1 Tax=Arundo donax TaxID=35708 RepID=A0A0A9A3E5_ARUDO
MEAREASELGQPHKLCHGCPFCKLFAIDAARGMLWLTKLSASAAPASDYQITSCLSFAPSWHANGVSHCHHCRAPDAFCFLLLCLFKSRDGVESGFCSACNSDF